MKLYNIKIDEVLEIAEKKKIVCFGGGRIFKKFCERFQDRAIENYIYCVIDNNEQKNKTYINVNGKDIIVNTIEEFLSHNIEDFFLIITCVEIQPILNQLKSIERFRNKDCGVANFIIHEYTKEKEKKRYYPQSFRITDKPIIPKVIHYCWFGGNPLPDRYKEWMSSWRKYCPDYEIIEWNESNYDITKNDFMYEAYKAKKWGFVPDFARLDIIYNYGGIYLDTDVEIIRNLDDLLYQEAFAGIDASLLVSLGLGFGAVPNNKMIRECLEYYSDKHFDADNMVAAPIAEEHIYIKNGYKKNGEYQIVNGMTIYPEKVVSPCDTTVGVLEPNEHSFSIHHYDNSWLDQKYKTNKKNQQNLYKILSEKNEIVLI